MKQFTLTIFTTLFVYTSYSQTFSGIGGPIPDNSTNNDFPISVSSISPNNLTPALGLLSVCVNVIHPYIGDLKMQLITPSGASYVLINQAGGDGNNFENTCFSELSNDFISNSNPPYTGTFKGSSNLGNVNNNQLANGTYILRISDLGAQDIGDLIDWNITFGPNAPSPFVFSGSDLPLVIINTNNVSIPEDTKITGTMGIIDNGASPNLVTDPQNIYSGTIGIEIRGQLSATFDQKQYAVETRNSDGSENDVSIFGMPAEHDWILYAPYSDIPSLRNVLTYQFANEMGRWAPNSKYCEVVINGEYAGIYSYMEKIKRDSNRVDIKKMTNLDSSGVNLTGGYIFSIDKDPDLFQSSIAAPNSTTIIGFDAVYPKAADLTLQQTNYLKSYVDSFELALSLPTFQDPILGYSKFISIPSFVDYLILNELSKNTDGYRISSFFHKNRITKGGKIKAGPIWDYNFSYAAVGYCESDITTGWLYDFNDYCGNGNWVVPFWWQKLITDTAFTNKLYCTYNLYRRTILDTTRIFSVMDSISTVLNSSKNRHFNRYSELGGGGNNGITFYQTESNNMKAFISARLAWMDANMPGQQVCNYTGIEEFLKEELPFKVYPNPASSYFNIDFIIKNAGEYELELVDIFGKKIIGFGKDLFEQSDFSFFVDCEKHNLSSGVYLARLADKQGNSIVSKKVVVNR